jgi:hypothetical protein
VLQVGKGRVKWRRLTPNIGYMRLGTQGAIEVFLDFLRRDAEKHRNTWRLWHTKHLIVMWETEGNQVEHGQAKAG